MCVYFCGGSCVEDVSSHLMPHLSLHPTLRTCSADTILRAIKELTGQNVTYTSQSDKSYDFNTAETLNTLLVQALLMCGSLYDQMYALRGWKKVEINGITFELNSILVEKWKGKVYRLVIQRQKRHDAQLGI